jgi:hypothetical protein
MAQIKPAAARRCEALRQRDLMRIKIGLGFITLRGQKNGPLWARLGVFLLRIRTAYHRHVHRAR